MRMIKTKVYDGRNIYSHKKCIRIDVDLEGYCEIPSKDIEDFNFNLLNMIPELNNHRCGIDEDHGFVKRLEEGTYLAHICEHIIIAIQNNLGIEVSYGKSREIKDDLYYIIFQYGYKKLGLEVAGLAIDIINALINKEPINLEERTEILKAILKEEEIGPSTKSICDAAVARGLPVTKLGESGFYQIGYGKQGRIIEASIAANTSCVAVDISCDKLLTKELLEIQNIPVARGEKIYNIVSLIKSAEEIGYPLVIKPQYGNKGKGVILNIKNKYELINAYNKLSSEFKNLMLEEYHKGNDYRVCVINYEVVAASRRIPPFIIGDGIKTIENLIDDLNSSPLRGEDHEKPLTKVKIDRGLEEYLNEQGVGLYTILPKGLKIKLRENANLSTGGDSVDCTDIICKENKELCIRAAKAIGLDICGIDICTEDIAIPIKDNGIVMEVNAAPGLRMHSYPSKGEKRCVGDAIVNMLYNNKPKNIPIISVTGTNGKTTTTRVISHVISKMGYKIGMTSTDGVYINDTCIHKGDDTGAQSAKTILLNKEVEVAVLETARGGIIKKGLAYDIADVAVITNITEDHLGIDGINTMEDLCFTKSLVAEAVKEDGYVVLNAEDKWTKEIIKRVKAQKVFFSKRKDNKLIQESIKNGGIAIYIENNYLTVTNNNRVYKICDINEIPITLNGKLSFNIENTLAVCGALVALEVDYCMIKNGLNSYGLNSKNNSGRFNYYDVNGINVILDYGHNIEGYRSVLSSVKEITKGKVYGVIGIPGDRSNVMAEEIGKISSGLLDKIIIKEDLDRRGRKSGETADFIFKGVKNNNKNISTKIILNEVEAFKTALKESIKGDTVIIFFEELEPLLEVIKEYKGNKKESENLRISSL
ncbi:cyanophycin synthetase [Clostridium chauvoei]|uniref:Cyanophycin synthetase n=2 Tax=Clostridium chauvoei TaxID=46867 RepID=A0A1U6JPP2_9CLOT|nr:cyanophycin synthetase [Clostridium chauvoei]ATD55950.1 cyanophycin synthetase [Clostridium chauvoei]ATD56379.1 cyanophycin synthetase [Clostridium chauvoei]MBX7281695.1 cyanophycin synthetase [Clostridium chauvoei]MBX7284215.1 cyanophycin synthetase [Clostridium chauvoei]MBX7286743.1 cyanophycin synthetase [Clostridium chauvoei]